MAFCGGLRRPGPRRGGGREERDRLRRLLPAGLMPAGGNSRLQGGAGQLREHFDDDAAVLGAAFLGLVRRDRLVLAGADDVYLFQRDLGVSVTITIDSV